jgi:hypothetical protein
VIRDENIVAVLDILGYTRLLEEMSLDDLESLIQRGILGSLHTAKLLSGEVVVVDDGALRGYEKIVRIEYAVVSDTIILYPKHAISSPLKTLCETVSLLMRELLAHGVLLRGALDVGTFRRMGTEPIFFGRALVGAHQLEVAQNWSGCSLTGRLARRFSKQVNQIRRDGLLVDYPVPMKPGVYREHTPRWALNWFYYDMNDQVAKRARLQGALDDAPDSAKEKVIAAIEFERFLKRTGLSFKSPVRKRLFDRSQIRGGYRFLPP